MLFENSRSRPRLQSAFILCAALLSMPGAKAQGPAPETAPTLFPGGGLISYNSIFQTRAKAQTLTRTSLPTFSHEGDFNFTWGFHANFDVAALVPVITHRFENAGSAVGGTGLGDMMVLVKYRFLRSDSERGTTQASVTFGPKLPTGQTGLTGINGTRLPATLQPGSGSTDIFLAANWTYTGLFNIRRLVADEDFHSLLRTTGTQDSRLGSTLESRFWVSYRPYEAKDGAREWFIGPELSWLYSANERIAGTLQQGSGGQAWLAGATTYIGVRPGMHLWAGMDWAVARTTGAAFSPIRRHISFGITQQFKMHL
jgi:hypothetical protein